MDILQEFEEYLPTWSNEKHLPIPTKQHMDRWYEAWQDFLNEVLIPRYEELQKSYLSMQYKTDELDNNDYIVEDIVKEEIKPEIKQIAKSNWELVQEKRKKHN